MIRSDIAPDIGRHVFERDGLGLAHLGPPEKRGAQSQCTEMAPAQPGGVCAHCGTGIMDCCLIRGADGRTFVVGTTCVNKTGDAGLIQAYKSTPEFRAHQADLRREKDARVQIEWADFISRPEVRASLGAIPLPPRWDGAPSRTLLESLESGWGYCGMSGRARYLKHAHARYAEVSA